MACKFSCIYYFQILKSYSMNWNNFLGSVVVLLADDYRYLEQTRTSLSIGK